MVKDADEPDFAALDVGGYVSNNDECCIKNEELCIENEGLCIKNGELCIQNL